MYQASADYVKRKSQVAAALGGVTRHIRAILGNEYDVSDDALRVEVVLNADGRNTKGISIGHKRMEAIANNVIQNEDDGDDYTIILETGEKIKPGELVLRRPVFIDSVGKSVDRDGAWVALAAYYADHSREWPVGAVNPDFPDDIVFSCTPAPNQS